MVTTEVHSALNHCLWLQEPVEHIIVSPVFGSSLGSVIGSLQTLSWSAYSVGPHIARILLIPDIARYKQSTTVFGLTVPSCI